MGPPRRLSKKPSEISFQGTTDETPVETLSDTLGEDSLGDSLGDSPGGLPEELLHILVKRTFSETH